MLQLIALEREPASKPVLSAIFRVVHSIKGASGFLGFPKMAAVTHQGEGASRQTMRRSTRDKPSGFVSGLLHLVGRDPAGS